MSGCFLPRASAGGGDRELVEVFDCQARVEKARVGDGVEDVRVAERWW